MLEQIRQLIQEQNTCVLATASENVPYTSFMAYAPAQDAQTVYLATFRSTKKYANISRNPSVSLLIDNRSDNLTPNREQTLALTITGTAASMPENAARENARNELLRRHPHLEEFLAHPDVDILAVDVEAVLLLTGVRESHYERIAPEKNEESIKI
ncbi:MAG: pyridoxamine 5'-phosphate oxidase family protein [Okeania sp. SIO3B3]|nr:pyridoxamine 5'-phosphate oxidase family protein [Okeania sp. SIO3B3]